MDIEDMNDYARYIWHSTREDVSLERMRLFNQVDGELFHRMSSWPKKFKFIFWQKPMSDKGTFEILLFLICNGCEPSLAQKLILSSTAWETESSSKKRQNQIQRITDCINGGDYKDRWFHFDIDRDIYVYLNGKPL